MALRRLWCNSLLLHHVIEISPGGSEWCERGTITNHPPKTLSSTSQSRIVTLTGGSVSLTSTNTPALLLTSSGIPALDSATSLGHFQSAASGSSSNTTTSPGTTLLTINIAPSTGSSFITSIRSSDPTSLDLPTMSGTNLEASSRFGLSGIDNSGTGGSAWNITSPTASSFVTTRPPSATVPEISLSSVSNFPGSNDSNKTLSGSNAVLSTGANSSVSTSHNSSFQGVSATSALSSLATSLVTGGSSITETPPPMTTDRPTWTATTGPPVSSNTSSARSSSPDSGMDSVAMSSGSTALLKTTSPLPLTISDKPETEISSLSSLASVNSNMSAVLTTSVPISVSLGTALGSVDSMLTVPVTQLQPSNSSSTPTASLGNLPTASVTESGISMSPSSGAQGTDFSSLNPSKKSSSTLGALPTGTGNDGSDDDNDGKGKGDDDNGGKDNSDDDGSGGGGEGGGGGPPAGGNGGPPSEQGTPPPPQDDNPTSSIESSSQSSTSKTASTSSSSCSSSTATFTTISCSSMGTSSSCTTDTSTTVGCSVTGSFSSTASCVASTTVASSTVCCSFTTISDGSAICAFTTMTMIDEQPSYTNEQLPMASTEVLNSFFAWLSSTNGTKAANSTSGAVTSTTEQSTLASTSLAQIQTTLSASAMPSNTAAISTAAPTSGTTSSVLVPGEGGVPGCHFVLLSEVGTGGGLCQSDYCDCGSTPAPLLTLTISGTVTTNCAYLTQPTSSCPATPQTSETPTMTTTEPMPNSPAVTCQGNAPVYALDKDVYRSSMSDFCSKQSASGVIVNTGNPKATAVYTMPPPLTTADAFQSSSFALAVVWKGDDGTDELDLAANSNCEQVFGDMIDQCEDGEDGKAVDVAANFLGGYFTLIFFEDSEGPPP